MIYVVIVSDLHCGSVYGIMPKKIILQDGTVIEGNKGQIKLYKLWKQITERWKNPDVLICNGDMIEGASARQSGYENWSSDVMQQVDAATQLLKMWNADRVFFTTGTPFHTLVPEIRFEEILAGNFGSKLETQLSLNIEGHLVHCAHHIGVSTSFYRTTAIAKEMAMLLLNLKSLEDYEWTIRSHAHYFCHVEFGSHHGIVTPCWQLQTPYMARKSPYAMVPYLGCLRLGFDRDGVAFEKFIVRPKASKALVVKKPRTTRVEALRSSPRSKEG